MPDTSRSRNSLAVLASVCLTFSILPLDFSGAAAATPAIARDLGGSPAELAWIVNALMLSFGSCVMAAGALADVYGRRRVFAAGIGLFVLTALAAALAPSARWLAVVRAVQGIAAAATLSGGSAALAQVFDGAARIRAFSWLGTSFGVGLALGPTVAGASISAFGWRAVFLPGAAIGLAALVIGIPRLRESRDPAARGVDWPGTATFTAALALFTFALLEVPASGWLSRSTLGLGGGAAVLLAAFVAIELRQRRPMLDLSLLRYPRFVGAQVLPLGTAACYVVLLIHLPGRFIGEEGRSELAAGALMLALSAPMLVVPLLAARCAHRLSAGVIAGAGLAVAAAGLIWLGRVPLGAPIPSIVAPMVLIGIGTGAPWGLMDGLAVSVVPTERAGMATGIFSTARVAGEGVALAATRAVLLSLVGTGHSYQQAFATLCTLLAVATLLSAAVVVGCLGRRPASEPTRRDRADRSPRSPG